MTEESLYSNTTTTETAINEILNSKPNWLIRWGTLLLIGLMAALFGLVSILPARISTTVSILSIQPDTLATTPGWIATVRAPHTIVKPGTAITLMIGEPAGQSLPGEMVAYRSTDDTTSVLQLRIYPTKSMLPGQYASILSGRPQQGVLIKRGRLLEKLSQTN
ncbi:hypothetical protein [Chitinophaga nivalis]|uniref:HlyD family secretion protein n=1 Tax=Chitinophaga nivalis TaxID=2991709 RepID=A0ABT3IVL1_9BACT|nr:hypothetical protein [Chitinophaga nivalis]MCW3462590.1 hypothetical protein [Chitinophaga nivalis]MCW3487719.1 hypothetical protein [Chitinophaga nivalis]